MRSLITALFLTLAAALAGCASQEVGSTDGPPFATVDNIKVPYTEVGSGRDAVVFVHGWCCDRTFWDAQLAAPELSQGRHLIALDLPGHGQADKPKTAYTMDLFVRSIAAVMDKAHVERAVLVGHSNGVPMIRQFYRAHPDLVAGLVVVDGPLRPFFKNTAEFEQFIAPLRGPKYKENAAHMVDGMLQSVKDPAEKAKIRKTMLAAPQWVMVGAFEATGEPGVWAEDTIRTPLLAVMAKSPYWTEGYEAYVKRLAPRCEYHIMDGVSHFLMMDRPAEFDGTLAMWLRSNGF